MEKKSIAYHFLRLFAFIMLIILVITIFLKEIGMNMYEKIFWTAPLMSSGLLIVDDIISDLKIKSKAIIKIGSLIFFINWILLSSMSIICLYLDFSIISKLASLLCIFSLGCVAYRKYMLNKNEEDIEREE